MSKPKHYEVGFYFKGYVHVMANSPEEAVALARDITIEPDHIDYYDIAPSVEELAYLIPNKPEF